MDSWYLDWPQLEKRPQSRSITIGLPLVPGAALQLLVHAIQEGGGHVAAAEEEHVVVAVHHAAHLRGRGVEKHQLAIPSSNCQSLC